MAIRVNYNFKGITIPDATIKVIRLWGSSKDGWNSLVGVYNTTIETVPAVEADEENGIVGSKETTREVQLLIEEFNHQADYKEDERGYVSIYKSLTEKYGGIKI